MKKSLLFAISICSLCLLNGCGGGSSSPSAPHVTAVTITPQFLSLTVNDQEQLKVSEVLSDGSTQPPRSPTWSSSNPQVASVNGQGMVSGVARGSAEISCSDAGITGSIPIIVEPLFTTDAYQSGTFLYLENTLGTDVVRLGMDLSLGGAVSEFSLNGSDVIGKASYGSHLIALGLYDGNGVYDQCNGCTFHYGWNPVESGDYYRHGSPILMQDITGNTIYIKSQALQWIPDDKGGGPAQAVPSDIVIEKWLSPVPNHPYVFQERYKITHTGNDRHAGQNSSVPSYEISANLFNQYSFYTGASPGTLAPIRTIQTAQMPQWPVNGSVQWLSEDWGAMTNQQGFGFGAYNPQAFPYAVAYQATTDPTDMVVGFTFLTPFSFFPGSSVQFDTFLMLGDTQTVRLVTYDIRRVLGPFADIDPPVGDLNDTPAEGSTVSGIVAVEGWAFDNVSQNVSVTLFVDQVQVATGLANITRPDIAVAYPGAPENPAFHFDLDTTKFSNGARMIEVQTKDDAGNIGLLRHRVLTFKN